MTDLLLPPVERPGFFMRLVYRIARRRYGRVLTPLRVIYSRVPVLLVVGLLIEWIREHALTVEPALAALIAVRVSSRHHCDFCADLGLAAAIQKGIGADRFRDLDRW